jgi:protein-disulfide isomerase
LSAQQTGASFDDTLEMFDLSTLNIGGWIQHTLTPLIAGFTGLNLEHDILSWMTGDYALSMSLIRATNELGVAPDVAFVTEVTDSDAASRVVDGLIRAGELYRLGGVAGEGSLTYPDLIPTVASLLLGSHPTVFAAPETDLKIASNDDTFAVGTAPTVNFALDPSGDSLATNAVYQHAEGFFLEAPTSVIFVNAVELVNAVNFLAPFIGRTEAEQLQFALSQIESASLSIATVNNNTAVVRLAVSVAEVGTVVQPVATPAAIDLVMPDDSASAQELQSSVLSTLQQASSDDVVTTTGSSVNIPTTVLEDSVVVIGEPSAPITIVVFSDFLCGSCNQFNNDITPLVVEEFVQTGMAQFEFRAYPIFGDVSVYHGQLLECSVILGGAEAYWPAKDILFASGMSNRSISDAPILLLADGLGIDAQALQDCQPTATQQHQANHLLGGRYFITGTPAVFVRYNNGDITPLTNVPSGGITFEFLSELILAANEQ